MSANTITIAITTPASASMGLRFGKALGSRIVLAAGAATALISASDAGAGGVSARLESRLNLLHRRSSLGIELQAVPDDAMVRFGNAFGQAAFPGDCSISDTFWVWRR